MMDGNVKYKGFLDCLTRVYKEQGLYSFWRGNIANVMRFFPNHSLNFAFKDSFKIIFVGSATKDKDFWKFFFGNLASGGVAGGLSLILTHPLDTMRTKYALIIIYFRIYRSILSQY